MWVFLLFVLEGKSFNHFVNKNPGQRNKVSSVIDSYSKLLIIHQRLIEK